MFYERKVIQRKWFLKSLEWAVMMRKRALWLNCEVSERWNIQVWTSFVCFFNFLFTNMKKSFRTSTGRQRFWLCLDLRREGFTTRVSWRWFHGRSDYLVNQNFPYNYVWDILMFRKTNYDRITRRSCQFNYYCIPSHINSIISCPNLLSVPDSYWQTTSSGDLVFLRRLEVGFFSEW